MNGLFIILLLFCNASSLTERQHFFPITEEKRYVQLQPLVRFRNSNKRPFYEGHSYHNPAFFQPNGDLARYSEDTENSPERISLSDLLSVINNEEDSKRFKTLLSNTKIQSIYFGIRR